MTNNSIWTEIILERDSGFQKLASDWAVRAFGESIVKNPIVLNHRFLEEALELVQVCQCTKAEAHAIVDYVFGREVGEKSQELGGVMVTLAALCYGHGLSIHEAGRDELIRIEGKMDSIRMRQDSKPRFGMSINKGSSDILVATDVKTYDTVFGLTGLHDGPIVYCTVKEFGYEPDGDESGTYWSFGMGQWIDKDTGLEVDEDIREEYHEAISEILKEMC